MDEVRNGVETSPTAWNSAQREAVIAEMDRIIADPTFRRSHRCIALFRCMIEHALTGDCEDIKERTLGIEAFGRDADYDCYSDPVVRMTSSEIRKRLAQYYQENDSLRSVKIRLVSGSYIPVFDFIQPNPSEGTGEVDGASSKIFTSSSRAGQGFLAWFYTADPIFVPRRLVNWTVCVLLVIAAILMLGRLSVFQPSQERLWKPLMQSRDHLIISVADNSKLESNGQQAQTSEESVRQAQIFANIVESHKAPPVADPNHVGYLTQFTDANVALNLSRWLSDHGQETIMRPSSELTLLAFHRGSVVLIGGFDNPWSVILLSGLRFSLQVEPATLTFWIKDAQNPTKREWIENVADSTKPLVDYAVITRFLYPQAGNWVLTVAGLGSHGTEAASQLLVDPAYSRSLPAAVRSTKNFQIVVRTELINGNSAHPQIVAFYTW